MRNGNINNKCAKNGDNMKRKTRSAAKSLKGALLLMLRRSNRKRTKRDSCQTLKENI